MHPPIAADLIGVCVAWLPWEAREGWEAVCLSWRRALGDQSLWVDLSVAPSSLGSLLAVLRRHGEHVESMQIDVAGAAAAGLRQLSVALGRCSRLRRLFLRGLSGHSLRSAELRRYDSNAPVASVLQSLRRLEIEYQPYFVLNRLDHDTGVSSASLSARLVAHSFPQLEELICDYLWLGGPGYSEGPPPLSHLRSLSLVALATGEQEAHWSSQHCRRDFPTLAAVAPRLETLCFRDPRLNVNRCSFRWGLAGVEDLAQSCREFCAPDIHQLAGACYHLPHLRRLEVETVSESSMPLSVDLASHLGVGNGPFVLRLGVKGDAAALWQAASTCRGPRLVIEVLEDKYNRMLAEVVGRWRSAFKMLQRFRRATSDSTVEDDSEESSAGNGEAEVLPASSDESSAGCGIPYCRRRGSASIAISFPEGSRLEYRSSGQEAWLPTVVLATDPDGSVLIEAAPKLWLSLAAQAEQLRPPGVSLSTRHDDGHLEDSGRDSKRRRRML